MIYERVKEAVFLARPNRFIAQVELEGREETIHVKNTGRCGEILIPGTQVWVQESDNPNRKTKYDLITARKGSRLINIDSQAPNKLFREFAESGGFPEKFDTLRPEYKWGSSRFDFLLTSGEKKTLVEVKGVTLEFDGRAYFPDAPTERGTRHLRELAEASRQGLGACVCFIVQMEDILSVQANFTTDPDFGNALKAAADAGVRLMAVGCNVTETTVTPNKLIEVLT